MRRFSFRPALTLRGRTFKGVRGWAGVALILTLAAAALTFLGDQSETDVFPGDKHPA